MIIDGVDHSSPRVPNISFSTALKAFILMNSFITQVTGRAINNSIEFYNEKDPDQSDTVGACTGIIHLSFAKTYITALNASVGKVIAGIHTACYWSDQTTYPLFPDCFDYPKLEKMLAASASVASTSLPTQYLEPCFTALSVIFSDHRVEYRGQFDGLTADDCAVLQDKYSNEGGICEGGDDALFNAMILLWVFLGICCLATTIKALCSSDCSSRETNSTSMPLLQGRAINRDTHMKNNEKPFSSWRCNPFK